MVLTQVPPVEHFFDGITRWFGQEGGDLDMITMTGTERVIPSPIDRARRETLISAELHPKTVPVA